MGGNRVYFRFLLRWRGPKSTFYYFFGGSKSVISKRSVISNPRLASGFQENLSCKTQMNVCAPLGRPSKVLCSASYHRRTASELGSS